MSLLTLASQMMVGSEMGRKALALTPEIVLLATAFLVMIVGLSPSRGIRKATGAMAFAGLLLAGVIALFANQLGLPPLPPIAVFVKVGVVGVGLLLLLAALEVPGEYRGEIEQGEAFDPAYVSRGEFYGFFLLSLTGAMLCATADDLIWLFLALELTSLPTYIMVATARERIEAPEAGVKYFFLGAFSAAIFLYGFTLLYGATGSTLFTPLGGVWDPAAQAFVADPIGITLALSEPGPMNALAMVGLLLAFVGVAFKTAAVPMHFYAADVYQGAATPVTAFLAFVPKTAGFLALIAILSLVGWPLDRTPGVVDFGDALVWLIWIMAAATMFVGNTLALRQNDIKRVLAYSSVAHTGYMLVGLLAGPAVAAQLAPGDPQTPALFIRNGIGAVLFYLVVYGVMNLGAFAVLGVLKAGGEEATTYDDLKGLARRRPGLAAVLAVCVISLAGLPPIVGFWGKLYLIGSAVSAGYILLVVLLVIASAIAAVYYLRIVAVCFLADPDGHADAAPLPARTGAAVLAGGLTVLLSIASGWLLEASGHAGRIAPAPPAPVADHQPPEARPDAEAHDAVDEDPALAGRSTVPPITGD